jgi:hypothetical protein
MSYQLNLKTAAIAIASATIGDNTIVAAVTATPILIHGIVLTVGGATNLIFKDGASSNLSGAMVLTGNGSSITLQISSEPYFRALPGDAFVINSSAAVSITGTVWYRQG